MALRKLSHLCTLIVSPLALGLMLHAQAGDPAVLQQKLDAQFRITTTAADKTDIVTPGDVVEIHKPGLVMFSVDSPISPTSTYKNGAMGQGFGTQLLLADKTTQKRRFVPGEKFWVTRIMVQNDSVTFDLYSDPYEDVRYYGTLKFVYPNKKTVPPVDEFLKTIAEVVTAVPQDNQGGPGQSVAPGNGGAGADLSSSVPGKYIRTDSPSDYIQLGSSGTFLLSQGGKLFPGTYKVEGDSLVISMPQMRTQQRSRITGDTFIDPNGRAWKKEAAMGETSAPGGTSAASA